MTLARVLASIACVDAVVRFSSLLSRVVACASQPPQPQVFRIAPLRPVEELRREALAAEPPVETGKRAADLVELVTLDPTIQLDVRYAGRDNFLVDAGLHAGARLHAAARRRGAGRAPTPSCASAGWGLLVHDAYRPWYVTKVFWDATPDDKKDFVADPAKGSKHNRGCAVDLTLYDLRSGEPAVMPSLYDEMSRALGARLRRRHRGAARRRDLLRRVMEAHGFTVNEIEWWHFDYRDWEQYPILNVPFEQLSASGGS